MESERRLAVKALLCIGAIAALVVFVITACQQSGCFDSDHVRIREYAGMICDGKGEERPSWFSRDYYSVFVEYVNHPDKGVREAAAARVRMSAHISGDAYSALIDPYIRDGRDAELEAALLEAWRRAKPNGWERLAVAESYLDLRRRQYLWAHPEFGRSLDLLNPDPRSEGDIWMHFHPSDREAIDERLAEEHDATFDEVRRNSIELVEALRAGTLLEDD